MKLCSSLSIVVICLLGLHCNKNEVIVTIPDNPIESGTVKVSFTESPHNVHHVVARLSRSGFEDRLLVLTLSDSGNIASGTFNNVPIGIWHLKVDAFDSSNTLRYTGETDVDVLPDEITNAELELLSVSGTLVINVTWEKSCMPLPSGAVSWWRGEGNADDFIGGNSGYFENGTTFKRGKVGEAFYFDGVDDRLRIPDAENLMITGSLTIESWILIESYPYGAGQILFRGDERTGLDPYSLTILNDRLELHIGSSDTYISIFAPVSLGRFIHVAGTLDSTTGVMKLYVDGVVKAETTTTLRPFRDLDPSYLPGLGIGNTQGTGSLYNHPFHGIIDEVTIYNRALSKEEIISIYKAGSAGKCKS